jgi:hypothetical protein
VMEIGGDTGGHDCNVWRRPRSADGLVHGRREGAIPDASDYSRRQRIDSCDLSERWLRKSAVFPSKARAAVTGPLTHGTEEARPMQRADATPLAFTDRRESLRNRAPTAARRARIRSHTVKNQHGKP